MLIKKSERIKASDITPLELFLKRRQFLRQSINVIAGGAALSVTPRLSALALDAESNGQRLEGVVETHYAVEDDLTPYKSVTSYNNFYEFGVNKTDPKRYAGSFQSLPWKVQVEGHCDKPGSYNYEDLVRESQLEERIYRFRCVEAWSMVIPWVGIPLASLLKRFQPTSNAKYVAMQTAYRPEEMPGQKRNVLDWPYVEGLTIAEAMHPLSLMVVGVYGEVLPNQNGAPMRLIVPWKYGYKSIKSIDKITFTETQPATSWNLSAPREYGFYSNVNPSVSHPRWSQSRERRIGEWGRRDTLLFNGYADEIGSLYAGLDLEKHF